MSGALPAKIPEKNAQEKKEKPSIFVDEPEKDHVVLGFPKYAKTIGELILNSKPQFTAGIFGDWGTGKSTLKESIKKTLEDEGCYCIDFNPWRYEREERRATIPLILTLISSITFRLTEKKSSILETSKNGETIWEKSKRIFRGLSISGKVKIPLLIEIGATYDFSKTLSDPVKKSNDNVNIEKTPIEEGLGLINELLVGLESVNEKGLKLVVFIDDLDRCSPDNAVEVLESLKLLFDINGVDFVLALSREIVETAIDYKYQHFGDKFNGNEYLKKIIQLPIPIYPWSVTDIKNYLESLLKNYASSQYKKIFRDNQSIIIEAVERNPREVKRFLNNFILMNERFQFNEEKELKELLALQSIHFRWEWFYYIIYDDKSTLARIKKILFTEGRRKPRPRKNSIEITIMNDNDLIHFLSNSGKIIFDISPTGLAKYRGVISPKVRLREITKGIMKQVGLLGPLMTKTLQMSMPQLNLQTSLTDPAFLHTMKNLEAIRNMAVHDPLIFSQLMDAKSKIKSPRSKDRKKQPKKSKKSKKKK